MEDFDETFEEGPIEATFTLKDGKKIPVGSESLNVDLTSPPKELLFEFPWHHRDGIARWQDPSAEITLFDKEGKASLSFKKESLS
jgi:hypothetical protein